MVKFSFTSVNPRFRRESLLQEPVGNKLRCNVCERRCLIVDGGLGWCRTRAHKDGRLYTLVYGALSSMAVNPIEKKPFYHFYPGSLNLTAGSWSCNFGCPWCQNWEISKALPSSRGDYLTPRLFVELAISQGCQGTSISFNEPTLSLEWSLQVFRLARERHLYNTFVTNGYMTPEALVMLVEAGLDAMNVDVKGASPAVRQYCQGIDSDKIWAVCQLARSRGIHLEITTLVIPTVNDSETALREVAEGIVSLLGPQVPWHVTAYRPCYKFNVQPTPPSTLERALHIGKAAGLEYVYTGNLFGSRYDNTHCPGCGTLLVRRLGFDVTLNKVRGSHCPDCGRSIAGVWPALPYV